MSPFLRVMKRVILLNLVCISLKSRSQACAQTLLHFLSVHPHVLFVLPLITSHPHCQDGISSARVQANQLGGSGTENEKMAE